MRRRALLALLGTIPAFGGCLGEDLNTIVNKTIRPFEEPEGEPIYFQIGGDDCSGNPPDIIDICRPISTDHQVSAAQHQQLVDRFGEVWYGIEVQIPSGDPQGPDAREHRTLTREVYNEVTIGDKIVDEEYEDRGEYKIVTSIELRQTGEPVDVEC